MRPRRFGRRSRRALVGLLGVLTAGIGLPGPAWAQARARPSKGGSQPLVFAPVTVSRSPTTSKNLERAIRFYEHRDFHSATIFLHRVLTGRAAVPVKERAEFFMGKALYHLRYYAAALGYFDRIVAKGDDHKYFKSTLVWLASVQRKLPYSAGILEKIAKYPLSALEAPHLASVRDELRFYLARHYYQQGDQASWKRAVDLLRRIPTASKYGFRARFFEGVTQLRRGQPVLAARAFKAILRMAQRQTQRQGRPGRTSPAHREFAELSKLSLARVFYQAGQVALTAAKTAAKGQQLPLYRAARKMLTLSVKYYQEIPQASPNWPQALFEESWALFMLDAELRRVFKEDFAGYQKSLGNIHTLNSPFFENFFFPETHILRAVTYFKNCRYRRAAEAAKELLKHYGPLQRRLKRITRRHAEDDLAFQRYALQIRRGRAGLPDRLTRLARATLTDRTFSRQLDYLRELDREIGQVKRSARDWRHTAIAVAVVQDLTVKRSLAASLTGEIARSRLKRLDKELRGLLIKANNVLYEINNVKLGRLNRTLLGFRDRFVVKLEPVKVDDEHVLWPFTGEYWKDELGAYRFVVRNKCSLRAR